MTCLKSETDDVNQPGRETSSRWWEKYPGLMHYTTGAGLTGIISTDCLWASRALFLNDTTEMAHFFDARLLTSYALPYGNIWKKWILMIHH